MNPAPNNFGNGMSLRSLLGGGDRYPQQMITGLQLDSRKVGPGDLFFAMPGAHHDGRQYIEQAIANGAAAVVAEAPIAGFVDAVHVPLVEIAELGLEAGELAARFYGYPSRALHTVGVTGTNGKTTTSRIIAQLFRILGRRCGVIGTLGATLADDISDTPNTTPDALTLQALLAQWRGQRVAAVSMEVSSHALTQGRVNGVEFDTAVLTNLSHDHLDYHGNMAAYGQAKMRLFEQPGLRHAVINLDDRFAASQLARLDDSVQRLTYSVRGKSADVRIDELQFDGARVVGQLHTPWGSTPFSSPLPGHFNVENLAAAVVCLALAGEDLQAVGEAVGELSPVSGRMQLIANELGIQLVIDYAHTPDALEHVLCALRPHVSGRLITVFGCGGDRDRDKRQMMGRVACHHSDSVVITSDNPRSESPSAIMTDIETGCVGDYQLVTDRSQAIGQAIAAARAGDCVVIAGKGHERYQIVEGQRLHFSDEEQARLALARRAKQ